MNKMKKNQPLYANKVEKDIYINILNDEKTQLLLETRKDTPNEAPKILTKEFVFALQLETMANIKMEQQFLDRINNGSKHGVVNYTITENIKDIGK